MSEQGYNAGAEQGNNVRISAPGWNKLTSFNDEVANGVQRNIQLTPRKQVQQEKGRLNTLAKAEGDIERGDWLVITGVAIDSDNNDSLFNFDPRPTVKKIESTDSDVTLAVALDTIYDGKYGRICVTGCCIAKIDAPSGALYSHYDKDDVAADGVLTGTNTDTGLPIFWNNGTSGESMAFVGLNLGGGGGGGDPQEYLIGTIKTTVVPTLSGFTSVTVTVTESTDQSLAGTDVTVEMLGEYPLAAGLYVTATKVKSYASGGTATERWLPLDYEVIEVTPPTP